MPVNKWCGLSLLKRTNWSLHIWIIALKQKCYIKRSWSFVCLLVREEDLWDSHFFFFFFNPKEEEEMNEQRGLGLGLAASRLHVQGALRMDSGEAQVFQSLDCVLCFLMFIYFWEKECVQAEEGQREGDWIQSELGAELELTNGKSMTWAGLPLNHLSHPGAPQV